MLRQNGTLHPHPPTGLRFPEPRRCLTPGKFKETKYIIGGGVGKAPEGLSTVPERPSGGCKAAPDPALQAEASLIAGN